MKEKISNTVLVAMSGGVDSSVAAALLLQQGYAVTGVFMKQWSDSKELSGACSWKEDRRDALRVAATLGIPLLTLDFEKEYKEWVVSYLFSEYQAGRTPNPDVMCNRYIKFGVWLEKARELGYDYLATGHYAAIHTTREGEISAYHLSQAKDQDKDQTYFLHQLNQDQLGHSLFPLGSYTKQAVRELAREYALPTAERAESMGICFVGEVPMRQFLEQKIPHTPGPMRMSDGTSCGTHHGLAFYTIGQRHVGVRGRENKPIYVVDKRFESNELILGYEDDPALYTQDILIRDMHWIVREPSFPYECHFRLRHRQELHRAVITATHASADGTQMIAVHFSEPQRAVTPGQFAVCYQEGECLGGGVIDRDVHIPLDR